MIKKAVGFCFIFILSAVFSLQAQEVTVKGTVINGKTQEPLPGVNILVKGTTVGTTTNPEGHYSLQVPSASDTLIFSFIGFKTKIVPVKGRSTIDVAMKQNAIQGKELVVIGFGTQRESDLTNSVATVEAEDFQTQSVQDLGTMLQGVVPGLTFSTDGLGGQLNNDLSFNIRGGGTIGAGSNASPLVLVDGMAADLNTVNPQDVKSITVLKGPAAAAVYGSRAAFGVILITTKNGKPGETTFSYSNNFKFTAPMGLPNMMDSHTFAMYFNEAATNDGQPPKFADDVIERIIKYQNGEIDYGTVPGPSGTSWQYYTGANANTDWFDQQYKDYSFSQSHNMSISGGSKDMTYYTSVSYSDQAGLLRYSDDHLSQYSFTGKFNIDLNEYVNLDFSTRFNREDYNEATHQSGLFFHNIARRWPTNPVKDPNGHYTKASEIVQLTQGGRNIIQTDELYLQGKMTVTPIEDWNIIGSANFRITNINHHTGVLPAYAYNVDGNRVPVSVGWNPPGYSKVYEFNRKGNFFNTDLYSNYKFDLGDSHHFKVMAGFNAELNKYRTIGAERSNLITPSLPTINTATDNSKATEGQYQHWATAGFFGRLNYNYKHRYLLQVSGRYDGTSRFFVDHRWSFFPSVSAGWDVAQESFWPLDDLISQFKVRASYGALGNQDTNNWYPFFPQMPITVNGGSWLIDGTNPTIASAPALISSTLTWEQVVSWTVGLDVTMLDHRLNVTLDIFKRKTMDMVGPPPQLPAVLGTAPPSINNADMQSTGFELVVNWRDHIGDDFSYSIRAVVSDSKQEILNYPNPTGSISKYYDGRMMYEIWGYKTVGIAKTDKEMQQHLAKVDQSMLGSNWGAGDIMYKDVNGDGIINSGDGTLNDPGDLVIIGNSKARYHFGLDLNAQYKNFDLRIFLQGVAKRDYMPSGPYFWGAEGGQWQSAGFVAHMDFFRGPDSYMVKQGFAEKNLDAYYPKPYFTSDKNRYAQTRYLQNAAYMRVKNVQIGYSIPPEILAKLGLSKLRVYLSGQNLFTVTSLEIFDPESIGLEGWSDGKTYPYSKIYSFGLELRF